MRTLRAFYLAILILLPAAARAESLEDLLVKKGVISRDELRGAPAGENAKVYWNNGTRLEFPDTGFMAQINTLLQPRYEFNNNDETAGQVNQSSFRSNATRIIMHGNALNQEFNYRLETDFIAAKGADGAVAPTLLDGYLQWNPCPFFTLRMGQFKSGVVRQFITGNAYQQIPDRSYTSDIFRGNYQQGARATFTDADKVYSLFASVYNGESQEEGGLRGGRNFAGSDTRMMGDVGLRANLMGMQDPFIDADLELTSAPALNVGLAYSYTDAENDFGDGLAASDFQRGGADANFKYLGYSLHLEVFWAEWKNDLAGESEPIGGYVQTGYMFTPKWEGVLRYGYTDCDNSDIVTGACASSLGAVEKLNEAAAGLNYYIWKQNLKAQLAYIMLRQDLGSHAEVSDIDTNRWMFQLSAYL